MPPLAARLRQLTYALHDPAQVIAAARALRKIDHPDAVDALCERLAEPAPPAVSVALVQALARRPEARVRAALRSALGRGAPPVRRAALKALTPDRDRELASLLPRLVREDPAWAVRRDAVRLLARWPGPTRREL